MTKAGAPASAFFMRDSTGRGSIECGAYVSTHTTTAKSVAC